MQATLTSTLTVRNPPTVVGIPPDTLLGQPYSYQCQVVGGMAPFVWTAIGLPAGLTISASGLISGTATANGPFTVTQIVNDSSPN